MTDDEKLKVFTAKARRAGGLAAIEVARAMLDIKTKIAEAPLHAQQEILTAFIEGYNAAVKDATSTVGNTIWAAGQVQQMIKDFSARWDDGV
jgi:hypothetical protein